MIFLEGEKDKKLEEKILRFAHKAEELINTNPRLGIRFLMQANKLYNGYNPPGKPYKTIPEIKKAILDYSYKYLD